MKLCVLLKFVEQIYSLEVSNSRHVCAELQNNFDVFLTVHHSIDLFHLPTLMHNSLFINNTYVTL